jgi:hypothetical protein
MPSAISENALRFDWSTMRFFDAIIPAAVLLAGMGPLSSAQQTPTFPSQPAQPRTPSVRGTTPSDEDGDPMARQMAEQLATKRNGQRQKQIVDDTAKLLQLAQQLKEEVNKGKADDAMFMKKAEEIEKLAKSVKEKMREGQ